MNPQALEILVLAALLHDIGKFAQRAGAPQNRHMAGEFCRTVNGRATHTHVLYTDYFIENDLPLPTELNDDHTRSRLARLAASHHKPDTSDLFEKSLQVADHLSAGTDRKSGEESSGDYKSARLVSIFEQIDLGGPRPLAELQKARCHRLAPLSRDPFPTSAADAGNSDYESLFKCFCQELLNLPLDMGVGHYTASLTALLEEYTWCIPSSTYRALSDISLYDHAVTTAAIAQALAVFHDTHNGAPGEQAGTQAKFLLLGGDLSGIQNYIFNLDKSHGSGVAKLFRARSFFLQALTRSVIIELLGRLQLLPVARIMDAGGRFILLLPATEKVRTLLPEFDLEVQKDFFDRFRGELSLNLCWSVTLAEKDFQLERFQHHLDHFNDALEARKLQKFDKLLASGHSPVIDQDYAAYSNGDCLVCHVRPAVSEEPKLCKMCAQQIEQIGTHLPRCQFLVFDRGNCDAIPLFSTLTLQLTDKVDPAAHQQAPEIVAIRQRGRFAYHPIAAHLPLIQEADIARWRRWGELAGDEQNGPVIDEEPVIAGEPKTFNLLALSSREEIDSGRPIGRSFLGTLKADVDNLGIIFSIGLQDRLSISRFASLARMLNHFFSDDMVRWIQSDYPDLYVVFGGGDDLFLIGPWRQMVAFAQALNDRFQRFVADRPQVTLSAGLAVTKPALPVHAMAAQAEAQLHRAKNQARKNAVSLLATTVQWPDFARLMQQAQWLYDLIRNGQITRGLVNRLFYYGRQRRAFLAGDIRQGIFLSHMQYDFARNVTEKSVPDPLQRAQILAIQQDTFLLDHIQLPVTWALYRLRKDS